MKSGADSIDIRSIVEELNTITKNTVTVVDLFNHNSICSNLIQKYFDIGIPTTFGEYNAFSSLCN